MMLFRLTAENWKLQTTCLGWMVMSAEKSLHSTNHPILHLNTNISDQNKPHWSFSREGNKASTSKHKLQTNFRLRRFWSDMNVDSETSDSCLEMPGYLQCVFVWLAPNRGGLWRAGCQSGPFETDWNASDQHDLKKAAPIKYEWAFIWCEAFGFFWM